MIQKLIASILLLGQLVSAHSVLAQDVKYLRYDTDEVPKEVYKARRQKLLASMGNHSIAFLFSAPERTRNDDVSFQYRQDDNFYYLTGLNEPNALLVLVSDGRMVPDAKDSSRKIKTQEFLFLQKKDPAREQWTGRRMGANGALQLLGFDYARETADMETVLPVVQTRGLETLYFQAFSGAGSAEQQKLMAPIDAVLTNLQVRHFTGEMKDVTSLVFRMRAIKDSSELRLLEKASSISALAHRQAMKSCEPGMHEYDLQAVYEYVFRRKGAEYTGYPCIVGAAENAVILHYESNRRKFAAGNLVLSDCAAEYHNYSSDLTRTYPAGGKFSAPQRGIYELVLQTQKACIAMLKPGVIWTDVQKRSEKMITKGLLELGIMKDSSRAEMLKFYMHGVGHSIGLDVHDVGAGAANSDRQPRLQAGMLYTVEPGIYISEDIKGVDPKYHNIGVRIEDVIEITPDGNKNLTEAAPREVAEIEALMKQKGLGNTPLD